MWRRRCDAPVSHCVWLRSVGSRKGSTQPSLDFLAAQSSALDAAPVADAERIHLDGGDVIVDGDVLVVRMHDRGRAGAEDHRRRIGIAVEEARIRGALAAADLRLAAGDLLV